MANKNSDKNNIDDDSFETISWHDCRIYAFAFLGATHQFVMDIDFILEWLPADDSSGRFRFRIAPATLVFSNAYDIKLDIETDGPLDIQAIRRENSRRPNNFAHVGKDVEWDWIIDTQQGSISLVSVGFSLSLRGSARITDSQHIGRSKLSLSF